MCILEALFVTQPVKQTAFFGLSVTFECTIATNISGYTLSFSAFREDNEVQTVAITGDVRSAITGMFTVTQDNNGTIVRCIATPDIDSDNDFRQTMAVQAYGQGTFTYWFFTFPCSTKPSMR